jgi:ferredoxin-NADP reductase
MDKLRVRVIDRSVVSADVVRLVLAGEEIDRLPDWRAGAHIDLVLPTGDIRQYSLCGDPRDSAHYEIAVQRDAGSGSAYIHDVLRVGDVLEFGGPRNNFSLVPAERYRFIAGGIGITPFLPMIAKADALGIHWTMLYLGRDRARMAFADRLAQRSEEVTLHVSGEAGRVDLDPWIEPEAGTKFYACGPQRLLDALAERTRGWPAGTVRMERFVAAVQPPVRSDPFRVRLGNSGAMVEVRPDETIVDALRAIGVAVLTSCSRGVCGTCETGILSGRPDHRDALLTESERADAACLFPCVSRSIDDLLVLDL